MSQQPIVQVRVILPYFWTIRAHIIFGIIIFFFFYIDSLYLFSCGLHVLVTAVNLFGNGSARGIMKMVISQRPDKIRRHGLLHLSDKDFPPFFCQFGS